MNTDPAEEYFEQLSQMDPYSVEDRRRLERLRIDARSKSQYTERYWNLREGYLIHRGRQQAEQEHKGIRGWLKRSLWSS